MVRNRVMNQELVSVIMPTYNGDGLLRKSIEAILSQTYTHLELLVTDDHSTNPETLSILRQYARKDKRVKIVYLPANQGPAHARNESIRRATGRYIAFCDSDDQWMPNKLEKQLQLMHNRDCALSFTSYVTRNEEGEITGFVLARRRLTFQQLKRDNKIGCSTAIYDTAKLGGKILMPDLRKRQDWGMLLLIMQRCGVAYGMRAPLTSYTVRKGSVSNNKFSLVKYNIAVYEKILGFSPLKALCYFTFLFMPSYIRKTITKRYCSRRFLNYIRKKGLPLTTSLSEYYDKQ